MRTLRNVRSGRKKMRNKVLSFAVLCILTMACGGLAARLSKAGSVFAFMTLDFPSAIQTRGIGINDQGDVSGDYRDATMRHGFVWRAGNFTSFDPPGSLDTRAPAINARGDIAGSYLDASLVRHGYVLKQGVFTTFDYPGATFTASQGNNNIGQIVGAYIDTSGNEHGFL